ncbi:ABC transporter ATP-binding protein/permease [Candidatus Pelagibacter sp.]|nr:ABC transporter ATP-binding protein/permease [Candidatus Pelagibacter sp.]
MIAVMALLDMIGIASIMPFMAVLINPEIIETNIILTMLFKFLGVVGVETEKQFLFTLGVLVFVLLIVSIIFKAFTSYIQLRFTNLREYTIGKRLVEGYLGQPYSWFLSRHSADLGKSILSEVGIIIGHGLAPMMELIAKSFVAIALISLLIFIDPKIALIAGFTIGIAYGIIYLFSRSYINRIGQERVKANQMRFTAVSEAFGASKEVKVGGLEKHFIKQFAEPAQTYARHVSSAAIVSQLPRYALEAVAFGGMLIVILYLMAESGSFINAVPILALYAFAGYRLMPALQGIYVAITQLRFVAPALNTLYDDIKNLKPAIIHDDKEIIKLNKDIVLKNIYYDYPNASRTALKNINLCVPANTTVGLVGVTGSGKTTAVDIILGLLEAQKGTLEIDGKIITENNRRSWQRSIGYVPQNIYLSDDTIAANIAFGIAYESIDQEAIERAAKIANIHKFIINELDQKYQTTIGERGVRLSGGQRQRIGIARALYHNPQVLILDEATSALDNLTEQAVMDEVYNFEKKMTIMLIAHRLSTVKRCDSIFMLNKGKIEVQGTFDELIKKSTSFRDSASSL